MTGKCVLSAVLFFVIKKGITDRPSPYLSFLCFVFSKKITVVIVTIHASGHRAGPGQELLFVDKYGRFSSSAPPSGDHNGCLF